MNLANQFALAADKSKYTRRLPAIVGLASGTITAPGSLGYKYVRIWTGMTSYPTLAINLHNLSLSAGLTVWVDVENDGRIVISGLRYTGV